MSKKSDFENVSALFLLKIMNPFRGADAVLLAKPHGGTGESPYGQKGWQDFFLGETLCKCPRFFPEFPRQGNTDFALIFF